MIKPKKTITKKEIKEEKIKKIKEEKRKYYETVGRRKTSTAQVRLFTSFPLTFQKNLGGENIIVNEKF